MEQIMKKKRRIYARPEEVALARYAVIAPLVCREMGKGFQKIMDVF